MSFNAFPLFSRPEMKAYIPPPETGEPGLCGSAVVHHQGLTVFIDNYRNRLDISGIRCYIISTPDETRDLVV